ncbi:MAG: hypothetical protein EXR80_06885 [Methylococcales bacterium]|nr:hypothetical protein [Methylococcales bacterium]
MLTKISLRQTAPVETSIESSRYTDDCRVLFMMLFTPLLLAMLPLLIKGNSLNSNWVSAFFLPAGILLTLSIFRHTDEAKLLKNTQWLVWTIHITVMLIFFTGAVIYPAQIGRNARTNYPSQQLAKTASAIWHTHQQQPLTIVITNNWLGGNVLLHTRPEPTVLIDNDSVTSPWVNRDDVASCGALVLTTVEAMALPAYADLFKTASAIGQFALNWGHPPRGEVVNVAWAILSPEPTATTCRLTDVH